MHGIIHNIEIMVLGAAIANGSSTNSNSAIIDMAGYESVAFVAPIADSAATGVATLTVQGAAENSGDAMAPIAGAVATSTCAVNDDLNGKALVAEVRKPATRFLRVNRASATANIAFDAVVAILTPHRRPVAPGGTAAATAFVSG